METDVSLERPGSELNESQFAIIVCTACDNFPGQPVLDLAPTHLAFCPFSLHSLNFIPCHPFLTSPHTPPKYADDTLDDDCVRTSRQPCQVAGFYLNFIVLLFSCFVSMFACFGCCCCIPLSPEEQDGK